MSSVAKKQGQEKEEEEKKRQGVRKNGEKKRDSGRDVETLPRSRRTNNKIAMRVTAMIALLFSRSIFRLVSLEEKYSSFVYVFYFILGLGLVNVPL